LAHQEMFLDAPNRSTSLDPSCKTETNVHPFDLTFLVYIQGS
jgi:hypothetical protein